MSQVLIDLPSLDRILNLYGPNELHYVILFALKSIEQRERE